MTPRFLFSMVPPVGLALLLQFATALPAAQDAGAEPVIAVTAEIRNRANVLLLGEDVALAARTLQARFADDIVVFRPAAAMTDASVAEAALGAILDAKRWHVVVLGLPPGELSTAEYGATLRAMVRRIAARNAVILWVSLPTSENRSETVAANDVGRTVMRDEGVASADLFGAFASRETLRSPGAADRITAVLAEPMRRALLSQSNPWAELPPYETRDPAKLLANPKLFADPMKLPDATGTTTMVYRAEQGEWQFNLHSFLAHHDGKFWAVWSSGRIDEDSSSQFIRYATSTDGLTWAPAAVLAPDPDGEHGPWRWMASGIYTEGGRLFALGSLNRGFGPDSRIWSDARLVRFEWKDGSWQEDRVVAHDCVVYFPPLRVDGRDFFVWRDSRAYFFTGYAPAGSDDWVVTRLPGPLPDYRMSETSAYVDPDGIVHLIIRDQGYTRRLYHSVSYDAGATWTIPVKTNYPDATSKNMAGRLSNGWFYLISNPKASGANLRDPLAITFSRDGWTFSSPMALRKDAPPLRFPGKAKGPRSFQYSHAIEHEGQLWVIYATNKEDIEVSAYPLSGFRLEE